MPIKIICEKRHHKCQEDIYYPAVFCDLCERRIEDAKKGHYYFDVGDVTEFDPATYYSIQWEPYFAHAACARRVELVVDDSGHFEIETPSGRILSSKLFSSYWIPLDQFPLFLARNLGMKL